MGIQNKRPCDWVLSLSVRGVCETVPRMVSAALEVNTVTASTAALAIPDAMVANCRTLFTLTTVLFPPSSSLDCVYLFFVVSLIGLGSAHAGRRCLYFSASLRSLSPTKCAAPVSPATALEVACPSPAMNCTAVSNCKDRLNHLVCFGRSRWHVHSVSSEFLQSGFQHQDIILRYAYTMS